MEKVFFTSRELADWLNCHILTVNRLVQRGELPAYKIGRYYRFRREDIEAWLEKQRVKAERRRK